MRTERTAPLNHHTRAANVAFSRSFLGEIMIMANRARGGECPLNAFSARLTNQPTVTLARCLTSL